MKVLTKSHKQLLSFFIILPEQINYCAAFLVSPGIIEIYGGIVYLNYQVTGGSKI